MYFTQDHKLSDLGPVWDKQERGMSKVHFTLCNHHKTWVMLPGVSYKILNIHNVYAWMEYMVSQNLKFLT